MWGRTSSQRGFRKDRFSGRIPPKQAVDGVVYAMANARRLYDDAVTLFRVGSPQGAVTMAILALEEVEKCQRVVRIAVLDDHVALQAEWSGWDDHVVKVRQLVKGLAAKTSSSAGADARGLIKKLPSYAKRLRERCTYVEFLVDGSWSRPSQVVSTKMATYVLVFVFLLIAVHLMAVHDAHRDLLAARSSGQSASRGGRAYMRSLSSKRARARFEREATAWSRWYGQHSARVSALLSEPAKRRRRPRPTSRT